MIAPAYVQATSPSALVVCDDAWRATAPAWAEGYFDVQGRTIYVPRVYCDRYAAIHANSNPGTDYLTLRDEAEALFILGHEEAHAAGVPETHEVDGDRGADCAGIASVGRLAVMLGASRRFAHALAGELVGRARNERCGEADRD